MSCDWNFRKFATVMARTRPTAVDLFWALERMERRFAELCAASVQLAEMKQGMVEEAKLVHLEKQATDQAIGEFGAHSCRAKGK